MELSGYLNLMKFPPEWVSWNVLPIDFVTAQANMYEIGDEQGSEHDRHGVFQWCLGQHPSPEQLVLLARLTWLDPDPIMAGSVRQRIADVANEHPAVIAALQFPHRRV